MELVVRGRNVEVPEHFRAHVADKLARVERYDARIIRTDVELLHERNPRQSEKCQRVEITCRVRGPVVRAEACAPDFYAALDLAVDKIERRFRQAADRRRIHHGRRNPMSLATATAESRNGATSTTAVLTGRGPGHRCRTRSDRPGEDPLRDPDHHRSSAAGDGAGGPRLLSLPRRGHRSAERRVPPEGLRLRLDPPGRLIPGPADTPQPRPRPENAARRAFPSNTGHTRNVRPDRLQGVDGRQPWRAHDRAGITAGTGSGCPASCTVGRCWRWRPRYGPASPVGNRPATTLARFVPGCHGSRRRSSRSACPR